VHGVVEYTQPVRVEPATLVALEKLVALAPLHQPHNLLVAVRLLLDRAVPGPPPGSRGRPDCLDAEELGISVLRVMRICGPHPNLSDWSGNSGMGGGDSANILR
jgi:hypothetical protein